MTMRLTERGHVAYAEAFNALDSANSNTHKFTAVLGNLPDNFPINASRDDNDTRTIARNKWDDGTGVPDSLAEPVAYYKIRGGSEDELDDVDIFNIVRIEDIDTTTNIKLPTNGDFSNGVNSWTSSGSTLTVSSNVLKVANTMAVASSVYQDLTLTSDKWYYLRCKLKSGDSEHSVSVSVALSTNLNNPYQKYNTSNSDYMEEVSFYFHVSPGGSGDVTVRISLNVNGNDAEDYGQFEIVEVHPLEGTADHTDYTLENNNSVYVINWGSGSGPPSGNEYRIWYWRKNIERRTIFNELVRKVVGEISYVVRDPDGVLDVGSLRWMKVDYSTRYIYLKFEFDSEIDALDSITEDVTKFYQVGIFVNAVSNNLDSTLIVRSGVMGGSPGILSDTGTLFMVDYISPITRTLGTVNSIETVVQN